MRTLRYVTVDVFTERRFAGNPLAIFPDAAGLPADAMQALAAEIGYSETTFVVGRGAAGPAVRIFTPSLELPFAGHPTLGTAAVLADLAPAALTLELAIGSVPVVVERTAYGARAELVAPPGAPVAGGADEAEVCAAIGVAPADRDGTLPVETWAAGNTFAFVAVGSSAALARARPVAAGADAARLPLGIVAFAALGPGRLRARVFVPGDPRIPEDPATGSANALLAAYLAHHGRLALGATLATEQGVEMGRPCRLEARAIRDPDGVVRARVAGGVVPVFRGAIDL
jgi:trans-2,3-dihydro-3-hydroxyanthranilate isomerase